VNDPFAKVTAALQVTIRVWGFVPWKNPIDNRFDLMQSDRPSPTAAMPECAQVETGVIPIKQKPWQRPQRLNEECFYYGRFYCG
jgi:hypothetical protein